MTIIPGSGRDYRTKAEVLAAFEADKDFIVADMSSRYDGKPVCRSDLVRAKVASVNIRYKGKRSIAVVKL
jgi:hypothetical protein